MSSQSYPTCVLVLESSGRVLVGTLTVEPYHLPTHAMELKDVFLLSLFPLINFHKWHTN